MYQKAMNITNKYFKLVLDIYYKILNNNFNEIQVSWRFLLSLLTHNQQENNFSKNENSDQFINKENIEAEIKDFSNFIKNFSGAVLKTQPSIGVACSKITREISYIEGKNPKIDNFIELLSKFYKLNDVIIDRLKDFNEKSKSLKFEEFKKFLDTILKHKKNPGIALEKNFESKLNFFFFRETLNKFFKTAFREYENNDEEQLSALFKDILNFTHSWINQDNNCEIIGEGRVFKKSQEKNNGADLILVFRIIKKNKEGEIRSDITKLVMLQAKDSRGTGIKIRKTSKDLYEVLIQPSKLSNDKENGLKQQIKKMHEITNQCGAIIYDINSNDKESNIHFIEPSDIISVNIKPGKAIPFESKPFIKKLNLIPKCEFGEIWIESSTNKLVELSKSINLEKPDLTFIMKPN